MLTIEGILALDNACVGAVAQLFTGSFQRQCHVKVGHCGIFNGCVLQRGVLKPDGTGGNHHIAGFHIHMDTAAGAYPHEGICSNVYQFFHGNGGGRSADTGGANGNLLPQEGAGPDVVLPIHADVNRIIKMLCDGLTATGVAGQQHIAAYVARNALNVKLFFSSLHNALPSFVVIGYGGPGKGPPYGNDSFAFICFPDRKASRMPWGHGTSWK